MQATLDRPGTPTPQPAPQSTSQPATQPDLTPLITDYLRADLNLPDLAALHGLSITKLLKILESPAFNSLLDRLTAQAQLQAHRVAAAAKPIALQALRHTATHDPQDTQPLPPALQARSRETTRKAAAQLARTQPTPRLPQTRCRRRSESPSTAPAPRPYEPRAQARDPVPLGASPVPKCRGLNESSSAGHAPRPYELRAQARDRPVPQASEGSAQLPRAPMPSPTRTRCRGLSESPSTAPAPRPYEPRAQARDQCPVPRVSEGFAQLPRAPMPSPTQTHTTTHTPPIPTPSEPQPPDTRTIQCSLTTGADRFRPDREGLTWRVEGRAGLVKSTQQQ